MLFDIHHLEPSAIVPVHDLFVVLQARAFEETAEGVLKGHAAFTTEYLAYDIIMTDGAAICQTFCIQNDAAMNPSTIDFDS